MDYSNEETVWGRILKKGLDAQGWKWNNPETFSIGNGERHTPDFYNEEDQTVVEMFGESWHPPSDEPKKVRFYQKNGWKCLILWSWMRKETISEKLNEFVGRCAPITTPMPMQTLADFIEPPSEAKKGAPMSPQENGKDAVKDVAKPPTTRSLGNS